MKVVSFRTLVFLTLLLFIAIMICGGPADPSRRSLRSGDIVVSKLGIRAVVVERSVLMGNFWQVRLQSGGVEIWNAREIAYRELE